MAKCKACGAAIDFCRTMKGNSMPVNIGGFRYRRDPEGRCIFDAERLIVVRGVPLGDDVPIGEEDGIGYTPHWATCPKADFFKRKGGGR